MKKAYKISLYKNISINSAGKLKSILMLLEKASLFLKEAKSDNNKLEENIIKVQNIFSQLQMSLNYEEGNVTGNLFFIFDFIFEELENRDEQSLSNAIDFVDQLHNIFKKIEKR